MSVHDSNISYKAVTIVDNDELSIVNGGMPIYIQGGKTGKLKTGGAIDYMMDDIDINLELADNKLGQLLYTFRVSEVNEIDDWINSNSHDFIAKCLRKFKIHMPYSNSLKGLFFDIVKLFEYYVLQIIKMASFNTEEKLVEYKTFDEENNIESSSVILYQFGKDEKLNLWCKKHSPNLAAYITDSDRWSYKGWCPHVPDIRYTHLLRFPLEMVIHLLEDKLDFTNLEKDLSELKKIKPPSIINEWYSQIDVKKPLNKKVEILHKRIKDASIHLKEWETYYIKSSEQILEQAKIFQKHFSNFGK
jgi:hypothetical protein